MGLNEQDISLIDSYLTNRLSKDEVRLVKERINASDEFKEEVRLRAEVVGHIKGVQKSEVKKDILRVYDQYKKEETKTSKLVPLYKNHYLQIAASLILLITSVFFIKNFTSDKTGELFDKYYSNFPSPEVLRGDASVKSIEYKLYTEGKYQEFINSIESNLLFSDSVKVILGNAHLEIGDNQKALTLFDSIDKSSNLYGSAQWYKALTFIKLGNNSRAIKILQLEAINTSIHERKAARLLEDLK